jgi:hypothetical protein
MLVARRRQGCGAVSHVFDYLLFNFEIMKLLTIAKSI